MPIARKQSAASFKLVNHHVVHRRARESVVAVPVAVHSAREVRVQDCLLGRDATSRVVDEQCIQKIQSVVVKCRHGRSNVLLVPLGERGLVVGEGSNARPVNLGGGTKNTDTCQYMDYSGRGAREAYRKILKISSISESPGNSGFRVHISAKMQPTDHISTPVEYCRPPRRISGARYQSVTTCACQNTISPREACFVPRACRCAGAHRKRAPGQNPPISGCHPSR